MPLFPKLSRKTKEAAELHETIGHKKYATRFRDSMDKLNLSSDEDTFSLRGEGHAVHPRGVVKYRTHKTLKSSLASVDPKKQQAIDSLGIKNLSVANYISSTLDKPKLFSVKPLNLLKSTGSYGLFSKQFIHRGTRIGEYTGKKYSLKSFRKHLISDKEADSNYAMTVGSSIIDAGVVGNFTRYINFSDSQSNVEFQGSNLNGEEIAVVVATKPIFPGQQLLVDYNVYDPIVSQSYYFLNPQDNWQSTAEIYAENKENYTLLPSPVSLPPLSLKAGEPLYVTRIGHCVINQEYIAERSQRFDSQVNLPYLKLVRETDILDATEADLYTPLMVACYTGQVTNAQWLIKHGANVDQQQNHSGNCPLFFALEGYRREKRVKNNYLEIIKLLIKHQANVKVHDREDKTFLHKAVSLLTPEALYSVMQSLPGDLSELYSFIDKNGQDILIYCIDNKLIEQASILFSFYPKYTDEIFVQGTCQQRKLNKSEFKSAIRSYSREEKEAFLSHLENLGIILDDAVREELNLAIDAPMHAMH